MEPVVFWGLSNGQWCFSCRSLFQPYHLCGTPIRWLPPDCHEPGHGSREAATLRTDMFDSQDRGSLQIMERRRSLGHAPFLTMSCGWPSRCNTGGQLVSSSLALQVREAAAEHTKSSGAFCGRRGTVACPPWNHGRCAMQIEQAQ